MRAAVASPPSLLPPTSPRTDVPEAEMPPRKRACLTTPAPGYEIGESSAAGAARQPRPTPEVDTWDEIVEAMMEIAPTTLEGVDQRVTELDTTVRQRTEEFEVRFEEARDDRAYLGALVNSLYRDRPYHRHTALAMDREAVYARIAWTSSEERSAAIELRLQQQLVHASFVAILIVLLVVNGYSPANRPLRVEILEASNLGSKKIGEMPGLYVDLIVFVCTPTLCRSQRAILHILCEQPTLSQRGSPHGHRLLACLSPAAISFPSLIPVIIALSHLDLQDEYMIEHSISLTRASVGLLLLLSHLTAHRENTLYMIIYTAMFLDSRLQFSRVLPTPPTHTLVLLGKSL
ncbi:hypothetical protein Tco_0926174 [Tanacetum coccineum]|uniref:Uncharacterized protein n=1 Tax=Tanacetum coccineum TaxID=301880 RepID=A0ABQ5DA62_9ASTR